MPTVAEVAPAQRWYREPWPWILMSGPAVVVVAGLATAWVAFATSDGLVAEDYYRQGLAINQTLRREQRAAERGIHADVERAQGRLRVRLAGAEPEAVLVQLVHPTRAGLDRRVRLLPAGGGAYEAVIGELPPGRWQAVIEDPRREWRLTGALEPQAGKAAP